MDFCIFERSRKKSTSGITGKMLIGIFAILKEAEKKLKTSTGNSNKMLIGFFAFFDRRKQKKLY